MTRVASILCIVSLLAAVPVAESLAAPSGGDAGASAKKKKKCPKGKVRQKVKKNGKTVKKNGKVVYKCVKKVTPTPRPNPNPTPPAPDAKGIVTPLISGNQFNRSFLSSSGGTTGEELWRFCPDGKYFRRKTTNTFIPGGGGTTSETQDQGTWTMSDAKAAPNIPNAYVATLALSGTFDGAQANGNLLVAVSPNTTQAFIDTTGNDANEYQRAPGAC